jgi:MFS family permease
MDSSPRKIILPVIVVSQFFCTSLWFAGNAVLGDIIQTFQLDSGFLANLTSSVQFGFISGTFVFAVLTIADRFSPSRVFFVSAIMAALCNLGITIKGIDSTALLFFRLLTGFFLAGIYPVGMKIASDHYQKGLGKSLGFLVGALVVGTSFPHLLKSITTDVPWKVVVFSTSALSFLGGLAMILLVPDGPFRKRVQRLDLTAFLRGYSNKNFRSASLGYFGHMWELYAFWAFLPLMLTSFSNRHTDLDLNVPLISFVIIASGGPACMVSGTLSQRYGPKKIATLALFSSCLCCLFSPLFLFGNSTALLVVFLLFWGMTVAADSPLFSTMVAQNAAEESRGSALTIMNCIGFSITIVSLQCTSFILRFFNPEIVFTVLALGPILGLIALIGNKGS